MSVIAEPVNTPEAWSARAETEETPWAAAGWSRQGQRARLQAVVSAIQPRPGETLLDYGCGTGELCDYLPRTVGYHGYDWATGMVVRAEQAHGVHPFVRFTDQEPAGRFDLVACIGCFNLPGSWSKQRTWHTIRHLWDTTGCRALAVSLYAGDDLNCLIYGEAEVEACGRDLALDATMTRHLTNDLLMVARR